jgi:hypothetical protein
MLFRFFPKEESYYEAFREHAQILQEAAAALKRLFEEYQNIETQVKHIEALEHRGDAIVRDIAIRLPKTYITPIDREDIHQLTSALDDVLDHIQAAAVRLFLMRVKAPRPPAHAMADLLAKCTQEINKSILAMENNQDVTFFTKQIKEYEKEGDHVNREAVAELFHESVPELEVVQWMAIYHWLETALDRCEDVAQIIDGVMLKNA